MYTTLCKHIIILLTIRFENDFLQITNQFFKDFLFEFSDFASNLINEKIVVYDVSLFIKENTALSMINVFKFFL